MTYQQPEREEDHQPVLERMERLYGHSFAFIFEAAIAAGKQRDRANARQWLQLCEDILQARLAAPYPPI